MELKTLMMTVAASALIASGAVAQDTSATAADPATTTEMSADAPAMTSAFTSISEMTVGDIVGMNVYEPNGDSIGDIDYIVSAGGSADAVIGIGGFLGLGEYTVALPLNELTYDADQQMIQIDTTKEALEEQPEVDESTLESLPDETLLADLIASAETSGDASATTGTMSGDAATTEETGETTDPATTEGSMTEGTTAEGTVTEGAADPATTEESTSGDATASEGTASMDEETTTEDDALKSDAVESDQATTAEEPATEETTGETKSE